MITLNYLISDLELRMSKSKPSDDFELSKGQIAYWIDAARDEITKLYIDQTKSVENSVVMEVVGESSKDSEGVVSVPLSVTPLDIRNGRGIVFVRDENGRYLSAKNNAIAKYVSKLSFAKPSSCNPVYTFLGDRLILEGADDIANFDYTIGIVPSEVSRRDKLFTDKYYILPSTVKSVLELAEEIGLRELYGPGYYDITDDGNSNNVAK